MDSARVFWLLSFCIWTSEYYLFVSAVVVSSPEHGEDDTDSATGRRLVPVKAVDSEENEFTKEENDVEGRPHSGPTVKFATDSRGKGASISDDDIAVYEFDADGF